MRTPLITLVALIFSGCATPLGELAPPPKFCVAAAKPLPPLRTGDDLIKKHAELRRYVSRENSKNRCLRRYVNAVTGLK